MKLIDAKCVVHVPEHVAENWSPRQEEEIFNDIEAQTQLGLEAVKAKLEETFKGLGLTVEIDT